jgi:hypothetical protein
MRPSTPSSPARRRNPHSHPRNSTSLDDSIRTAFNSCFV